MLLEKAQMVLKKAHQFLKMTVIRGAVMSAPSAKNHVFRIEPSSRRLSSLVFSLLACLGVSTVQAQKEEAGPGTIDSESSTTQMETVTVTGTRISADKNPVNGLTTVISREMIESRADENVIDLLRGQSGVHVAQAGGRGGVASVQLRGGDPNFTLVLVDGVKVNDPTNARGGSFDFSALPLAQVERIEIIRGAQSSVYGSDGLGGVVSISTREPSTTGGSVDVALGESGFRRGSVSLSSSLTDASQVTVTAASEDDGEMPAGNAFTNDSLTVAYNLNDGEALSLSVRGLFSSTESQAFPDDSGGQRLSVLRELGNRETDQRALSASARYQHSEQLQLNVLVGSNKHGEMSSSPAVAPGVRDGVPASTIDSELQRENMALHGVFDWSDETQASVGVDYLREEGELIGEIELFPGFSLPQDFALDRTTTGFFSELVHRPIERFAVNVSLRIDKADGFKEQVTGRLGVEYRSGAARFFLSGGEGFKLPSFYALGHALVGNPDLKPETSQNVEAGVEWQSGPRQVSVSAFRSDYKNLINFDPTIFRLVNESDVRSEGVELTAGFKPTESSSIALNATYVDVGVEGGGALLQRPDWRFGLNAKWQFAEGWSASADWIHVGDFLDSSVPTGLETVSAYNRLDVGISWRPSAAWRAYLAVDNALNKSFETAIGFPGIERRLRLGATYRF